MHYLIRIVKLVILICTAHLVATNTARSNEICSQASLEISLDSLPCQLQIISLVEVLLQSELLEKHKNDYERLIRLRLRNDLSMIKHEKLALQDAFKKYEYDFDSKEMRDRGFVTCVVWTVGDDYPVAQHVKCELRGYGSYKYFDEFSYSTLGFSNSIAADEEVRDAIRMIIENISSSFLEKRDHLNR